MTMELVIKIPEESYKATCNGCMLPPHVENVVQGIKNGIPLPKGHGDLIDRSELLTVTDYDGENERTYVLYEEIDNAHVIIEADKEINE